MAPSTNGTNGTNGLESIVNGPSTSEPTLPSRPYTNSTHAIHADDHLNRTTDIAPALHVSTTFRYASNPSDLIPAKDLKGHLPVDAHIYSRYTTPNTTRLEYLLQPLLKAPCLTYSSGLSALYAVYVFLNPKRVSIGGGYHGSHGVLGLHTKLTGAKKLPLDCAEEELGDGDVIHLETPVNPTGEAFNISEFAEKAHRRGASLLVDATFAPPGLQDPFQWGADIVMHSGTKYLGGHSDMLCGVLATNHPGWMDGLKDERTYLGSVMGSLEGWLGVRSLRTLEVRVTRQSGTAEKLVTWLDGLARQEKGLGRVVEKVWHASVQRNDMDWLKKQMPNGFGPVFAVTMRSEALAKRLPSKLDLFHHATSLGGVESLIEWRAMSDKTVDTRLLRVSVGLEGFEDLKDDLLRGFEALLGVERDGTI
jgi:cystathionine beta-lyase/cystathionine gamma-synthase